LIADLKSDLSGNFENVIVGLMMPTERYCAHQLHKAFRSKSHDVLVEILCSRSHEEVAKIATAYEDSIRFLDFKLKRILPVGFSSLK
jgi:hypothetical protein